MSSSCKSNLWRQLAFLAAGPLLCLILKDMPPPSGLTEHGMVCLAGCAWLLVWWMTEVLPLPVTSLMAVPIFAFLGVMEPGKVFSFIASTVKSINIKIILLFSRILIIAWSIVRPYFS